MQKEGECSQKWKLRNNNSIKFLKLRIIYRIISNYKLVPSFQMQSFVIIIFPG